MKKLFIVFLLLIMAGAGYASYSFTKNAAVSDDPVVQQPTETPAEATQPSASPSFAEPQTLVIDALGIKAEIEHVGLAPDNRMDIPKEDMNVAWYRLGPRPGQAGSAVIAGHFDAKDGSPAVFNKLETINIGTTISVTTSNNQIVTFTVTDVQKYKDAAFPIEKVFKFSGKPMLNLITCDGVFDSASRNYSDRVVVFAEKEG